MRNKKNFSFDEQKDAEEVIKNGFPNGVIDYSKMYLLGKYFRDNFGYGAVTLERELIAFCKEQDKNFNPIVEAPSIKRWVSSAMKYELRKIDKVQVSQKEIDFLKTIEIDRDRKILFIILVLAKAIKNSSARRDKSKVKESENYYIRYNNLLDIIRISKLTKITEIGLAGILNKYKGILEFYSPEQELIKVNYVDTEITDPIDVNNLDDMMSYYVLFFETKKPKEIQEVKEPICSMCGVPIVRNSNRQRTCSECSKKLERERKAKWKVKEKEKQKVGDV